jgi:hypothetical protein
MHACEWQVSSIVFSASLHTVPQWSLGTITSKYSLEVLEAAYTTAYCKSVESTCGWLSYRSDPYVRLH